MLRLKYLIKRFLYTIKNDGVVLTFKKIYKTIFYSNKINLDKLKLDKNLSLDDLFLIFGTDKGSLDGKKTYYLLRNKKQGKKQFKNYYEWINRDNPRNFEYQLGLNHTPYYEKHFAPLRNKQLKVLEIGVANGHSIASWYYYFPNSIIHAVDIKKSYKFFYKANRIFYHSLDCTNNKDVTRFITKNKNFDIIVEDANYLQQRTANNIKNFYPTLNPGGIYILEDFKWADEELEALSKYNDAHGGKMMTEFSITMHKIFELIKKKEIFKHEVLKKSDLNYLFDTTEKVEVYYSQHPGSSMGLLFKKS